MTLMPLDILSQTIPHFSKENVAALESSPAAGFDNFLHSGIQELVVDTNQELLAADKALAGLAAGKTENLHQSMLSLEKAKLSFQFLEQIRNRLMAAYQEILREQI